MAGVVQELAREGRLGRYASVSEGPTFPRAAAAVIAELRLAQVGPEALATVDPGLAALAAGYAQALEKAGLVDRAGVVARAAARAAEPGFRHPLLDLPTLIVDVPLPSESETALVAAVARRAPAVLMTAPTGDAASLARLRQRVPLEEVSDEGAGPATSLERLQAHLFEDRAPEPAGLDDDVVVLSAPGESRECVEVVRRLLGHARAGVPFDRMAILLRSVAEYRPHLEEALHRAGVPAWFAQGATRPDPAGRAFLALLACRAEGFSAARFAEYLSLGEVPPAVRGRRRRRPRQRPRIAGWPRTRSWSRKPLPRRSTGVARPVSPSCRRLRIRTASRCWRAPCVRPAAGSSCWWRPP